MVQQARDRKAIGLLYAMGGGAIDPGDLTLSLLSRALVVEGQPDQATLEVLEWLVSEGFAKENSTGFRLTDAGRAAIEWHRDFQERRELSHGGGGGL